MPFTIHPRPLLKCNPCSRDQTHSLLKRKQSSVLFPTPACDVLTIPPSKTLALFTCLIESFMATSHCLGKQPQVINVPSAAKTHFRISAYSLVTGVLILYYLRIL